MTDKKLTAEELKVVIDTVTTQNIYESPCRAGNHFYGAVNEMAPDEVSALSVLGGGVLVRAGVALGFFSDLKLVRGRLARMGFGCGDDSDDDSVEDADE